MLPSSQTRCSVWGLTVLVLSLGVSARNCSTRIEDTLHRRLSRVDHKDLVQITLPRTFQGPLTSSRQSKTFPARCPFWCILGTTKKTKTMWLTPTQHETCFITKNSLSLLGDYLLVERRIREGRSPRRSSRTGRVIKSSYRHYYCRFRST